MKIGYVDCFSGISGDMLLGSLVDCGLPLGHLVDELAKLKLPGMTLSATNSIVSNIKTTKVVVDSSRRQDLRSLPDISKILETSQLAGEIIERSLGIFKTLAGAEAKIHGIDIDRVHFHEIGALDTIVDVVGTVIGIQYFAIERLICSPLPLGRGFIDCAHGRLPLPAPAVCEILRGVPTYGVELQQELVTPTGAAIIATLADSFGQMIPMRIGVVGYGAGDNELTNNQPNVLRLFLGESIEVDEAQQVEVIETNIDDWSPEGFPHLFELLFKAGALDVSVTPIHMKKGRPGFCLQVIARPAEALKIKEIIFRESSAIGLRYRLEQRMTLPRQIISVETPWGPARAKLIDSPSGQLVQPEYEECRRIAAERNIPLMAVYDAIRTRY